MENQSTGTRYVGDKVMEKSTRTSGVPLLANLVKVHCKLRQRVNFRELKALPRPQLQLHQVLRLFVPL